MTLSVVSIVVLDFLVEGDDLTGDVMGRSETPRGLLPSFGDMYPGVALVGDLADGYPCDVPGLVSAGDLTDGNPCVEKSLLGPLGV